jgi:hypothetical protein
MFNHNFFSELDIMIKQFTWQMTAHHSTFSTYTTNNDNSTYKDQVTLSIII